MNPASTVIILLGPPGSGKGTQSAGLAKALRLEAISTGEVLRRECDSGSAIGEQVRSLLAAGFLVGDELMNQLVMERLSGAECEAGCILDGYPRTINQAHFLDNQLRILGVREPAVFDFVVSPDVVIERLSQRRQCPACGKIFSAEFDVYGKDLLCDSDRTPLVRRNDDNASAIRERLGIYQRNTSELVDFYKHRRYFAVDAMQTPAEIAKELMRFLQVISTAFGANVIS